MFVNGCMCLNLWICWKIRYWSLKSYLAEGLIDMCFWTKFSMDPKRRAQNMKCSGLMLPVTNSVHWSEVLARSIFGIRIPASGWSRIWRVLHEKQNELRKSYEVKCQAIRAQNNITDIVGREGKAGILKWTRRKTSPGSWHEKECFVCGIHLDCYPRRYEKMKRKEEHWTGCLIKIVDRLDWSYGSLDTLISCNPQIIYGEMSHASWQLSFVPQSSRCRFPCREPAFAAHRYFLYAKRRWKMTISKNQASIISR